MRPLTLRMTGLRSYRVERTVDFTGLSLVAIVGPTGAGKSAACSRRSPTASTAPPPGTGGQ